MLDQIPIPGSASSSQQAKALEQWLEAAKKAGIAIESFPINATLEQQIAWAKSLGLALGLVLARYSSQLGHSTAAQIEENVRAAAALHIFVPPSLLCVDEAVTGRKQRRDGVIRAKAILASKMVDVLLVFKVSRLFRVGYKGFAFIQEEVVDEGLRAISVTQNIDTRDGNQWKMLVTLHGLSDELLLGAIADHVRAELKSLFRQGYSIGALPIGYYGVEVPGARPTNRGRPRTMPAIDEQAAEPIREAFRNVMMGMSITRAWRRYREVGGRTDPRAKPGPISYSAFRRLLSNPRLRGVWAYGRRRNVWSHKRDGMRQIEQPETEVIIAYVAELQIIDDETFDAVQAVLEHNKLGPRGPKKAKQLTLADLITELFVCAGCTEAAAEAGESRGSVRFYQSGANGDSMRCRHGSLCPHKAMVKRRDAAKILCKEVAQLIRQDQSLVLDVVRRSLEYGAAGAKETQERLALVQRTIAKNARRMVDLTEFLADACDEERAVISAKIEALKLDNADLKAEASRLTRLLQSQRVLEPAEAEQLFEDCLQLLTNAADGQLGEEAVYRAFSIIKAITQGRIDVEVVKRPKRSRGYVRGKFTYDSSLISEMILGTVVATPSASPPSLVSFWLRSPCRMDLIAERVHQLVDIEGYSFHEAAELLTAQGEIVSHSYAWQCHRRYWQMMGEPPPDIPYNNRRPRRSA